MACLISKTVPPPLHSTNARLIGYGLKLLQKLFSFSKIPVFISNKPCGFRITFNIRKLGTLIFQCKFLLFFTISFLAHHTSIQLISIKLYLITVNSPTLKNGHKRIYTIMQLWTSASLFAIPALAMKVEEIAQMVKCLPCWLQIPNTHTKNHVWWHVLVIPELRRWRQDTWDLLDR